jgi:hypothetical protein
MAKRFRLGRTIQPARCAGLRSVRRMPRKREGFWRLRPCSTGLRGRKAAKTGGMDRQTLRDRVIRFNEQGPDGLINIPSPGVPPKLDDTHKAFLCRTVEDGPIPAIHGVVRWRACDLIMRLRSSGSPSTKSSTAAATPGTRSSISPGKSCPSLAAIGKSPVTPTGVAKGSGWRCSRPSQAAQV